MKTWIWVGTVLIAAVGVFAYLTMGDGQTNTPILRLSHFANEKEIATAISESVPSELAAQNFYWVGLEPDKTEQIEVALQIKNQLEKTSPFQAVVIDQELTLSKEWIEKFKATEVIGLKANLFDLAALLQDLETKNIRYFVLTASIYSNPLIKKNQINQIKEKFPLKPITLSMAYFPTTAEQEKNMLFRCDAEDRSGTNDWACAVVSKARQFRRRLAAKVEMPWVAAMDQIGQKDFILILNGKTH